MCTYAYKIITNNNLYNILLLFALKIYTLLIYLYLIYLRLNLYLHTYLQNYIKSQKNIKCINIFFYPLHLQ